MISYAEAHRRWTYDPLTGIFYWKIRAAIRTKVGSRADVPSGRDGSYRCLFIKSKKLMAHKVAWLMANGYWPEFQIDHINIDGTNNAIKNLRCAEPCQNYCNRRKRSDNRSGHKGVHWHSTHKRWVARVNFRGKIVYSGTFKNLEDAAEAYRCAATKHHGEFARVA